MRRFALILAATALATALAAPQAIAAFGLKGLDLTFTDKAGSSSLEAGSHPFALTTNLSVNTSANPNFSFELPDGEVKDLVVDLPPGLVGTPTPVPRCSGADFSSPGSDPESNNCADSTALGVAEITINEPTDVKREPVYNLVPPPGAAAKLGFHVIGAPVTAVVGVNPDPPYNLVVRSSNILSQVIRFYGVELTTWGIPADPAHDGDRGRCAKLGGSCPANVPVVPFLTLPTRCEGPLATTFRAAPWQSPEEWFEQTIQTHDDSVPSNPLGTSGCEALAFDPKLSAQPTSRSAESPSGLDVDVDVIDEGLVNPEGRAASAIKKAVVTLPEGVTLNPSQAEGLVGCTEADLGRERADSQPGEGCPEASKVGTVEVETPLLEGELLKGSLFVAKPYENLAEDSLIALYLVIKDPELGILVKLPGKVEPDPRTGQLRSTFGAAPFELPQYPFSHIRFHLREGGRSPLVTPRHCGKYETKAVFTPWANPGKPLTTSSSFEITSGVAGACPPAGAPPFEPGFEAGSKNNAAGAYSPFLMRLTRRDGDQDLTRFDATLPRGVTAKLAGASQCPDAAIAAAKAKTGTQELTSPSCPANSKIGSVLAGAGVGTQLTYVPGSVYLAGRYGSAPLSVVGVVPAVAGPFDVGTVVTRQALVLDPVTAEVKIDGALSDPIPHILAGIPLRVRDIRVDVDRPSFTLNPTSCDSMAVAADIWGSGSDLFSPLDDAPVPRSRHFQAADCASLGFKPKLSLRLKGGTERSGYPALRAVLKARPGDANIGKAVVTLPHSAFLAQEHIRTICTRVQFAADNCPKGSIYGKARAFTPLLDEPLEGPVYLRSSSNPLPDMVVALRGIVDINLVGRIDSVNASIRSSFARVPDAPVTKFVLNMQGGRKGLIVNSRNLCQHESRALVAFTGQNGKARTFRPVVKASCAKKDSSRGKQTRGHRSER